MEAARPPRVTEPVVFPLRVAVRFESWAALGADDGFELASRNWRITSNPALHVKARRPSRMGSPISASAMTASAGRSARRTASSRSAMVTTGSFFFIGGPLLEWLSGLAS
jgi:hypothetical protein